MVPVFTSAAYIYVSSIADMAQFLRIYSEPYKVLE
jgi:hypothetical protein